jgi:hypothetical protein
LKRTHAAEVIGLTAGLLGILPNPLQAFAGPFISQLPITPFNMVCTSVPGPQAPLYLFGHKMLRWYPYVPVGGELALNCAILSYNGMVYFGFSGDAHAAPDLTRLERLLRANFKELCQAAGIQTRKKNPPPKATTKITRKTRRSPDAVPAMPTPANITQPVQRPPVPRMAEMTPTDRSIADKHLTVLQQTA